MLRMIDRHAVQQMLTAGVRIGEVARYFEVSRRTIERIRKEPAVEGAEGAVARWKRGVGRPPVPATVRERMRALIAEDPEEAPLEVLRRLREEGHRLGESTFYRLHRAEQQNPRRAVGKQHGNRVVVGLAEKLPRPRDDDVRYRAVCSKGTFRVRSPDRTLNSSLSLLRLGTDDGADLAARCVEIPQLMATTVKLSATDGPRAGGRRIRGRGRRATRIPRARRSRSSTGLRIRLSRAPARPQTRRRRREQAPRSAGR
jgi:transposase-like protein